MYNYVRIEVPLENWMVRKNPQEGFYILNFFKVRAYVITFLIAITVTPAMGRCVEKTPSGKDFFFVHGRMEKVCMALV